MNLEEIYGEKERGAKVFIDETSQKVITLENTQWGGNLNSFTEDIEAFKEVACQTIEENKQMLEQKISTLEESNRILEESVEREVEKLTEEMNGVVDVHRHSLQCVTDKIEKSIEGHVGEMKQAVEETHKVNKGYWRSEKGFKIVACIYLAITPALILLEFWFRNFG